MWKSLSSVTCSCVHAAFPPPWFLSHHHTPYQSQFHALQTLDHCTLCFFHLRSLITQQPPGTSYSCSPTPERPRALPPHNPSPSTLSPSLFYPSISLLTHPVLCTVPHTPTKLRFLLMQDRCKPRRVILCFLEATSKKEKLVKLLLII